MVPIKHTPDVEFFQHTLVGIRPLAVTCCHFYNTLQFKLLLVIFVVINGRTKTRFS